MKPEQNLKTQRSIMINSSEEKIWDVLVNPEKIKLYLFGSEVTTSWKVGDPVTFTRTNHGQQWQDKGEILEIIPGKLLKFSYWSSQEGYEDKPENYSIVAYTLEKETNSSIKLTYCREKIPIEFELKNQERFLPGMLENIKKLAEQD